MSRSRRIVIACVTNEVAMVSSPVGYLLPDEIHIYHFSREPGSERARLHQDHYDEVVRRIGEECPACQIFDHSRVPVYRYAEVFKDLNLLYDMLKEKYGSPEILINGASGPSQFIEAARLFTELHEGAHIFDVATTEFTVDLDRYRDIFYEDGRPVGLSKKVSEPRIRPKFGFRSPDETLVRSFRLYVDLCDKGQRHGSGFMVYWLKRNGLWNTDHYNKDDPKCSDEVKEIASYKRNYLNRWVSLGWAEKPEGRKQYVPTETGRLIVSTFYVDGKCR